MLDLTNALAASSAAKILGDLGAEVIKIEKPDGGDYTRTLMPYIFEAYNRGKRSVVADLKTADGVDLVKRLAATCDVLVQSMRPGAAREIGLAAEDLHKINPRLIYASLAAFGQSGPSAQRRGVDGVAQAESGLASLQNGILANTSFVDTTAGLSLSQTILIALMTRDRYGTVAPVSVSLLDTAVYMQSAPIAEYTATGVLIDQRAYPSRHPMNTVYETMDGPIYIAPYWERDWTALCEVVGRDDLVTVPRFADRNLRGANW